MQLPKDVANAVETMEAIEAEQELVNSGELGDMEYGQFGNDWQDVAYDCAVTLANFIESLGE